MRAFRVVMVMVLVGAAVAAVPASHGMGGTTAATRCTTGKLKVFLGGGPGGAAGSVYVGLHFVNAGTANCALKGFPGVSFIDAQHHRVGAAAQRTTPPAARHITLRPGAQASVVLRITQTENYPTSTCKPKLARGLRVYPPGSTRSTFVTEPRSVCSSSRTPQLSVTALAAGAPQS